MSFFFFSRKIYEGQSFVAFFSFSLVFAGKIARSRSSFVEESDSGTETSGKTELSVLKERRG